jgi:triosephosphate isomerase
MYKDLGESAVLIKGVLERLTFTLNTVKVVICPPFTSLALASSLLKESTVGLGAQNMSEQDEGAYTGEISGRMLLAAGCRYVIVGHSERRATFGECDAVVAGKFEAVLAAGLTPILCVGETLQEREAGVTEQVVGRQLRAVMDKAGAKQLGRAVIAYEPVWAIGTGRTATPEQAQEVHRYIRLAVMERDGDVASNLKILYGGSVKGSNAAQLFAMPDIDGGLIGGASLAAGEFMTICRAGERG